MFERLFGDGDSTDPQARLARLEKQKSVLDYVTGSLSRLQRRLGAGDKRKLEEYLEAVRDIERRIRAAEEQSLTMQLPHMDRPGAVPDDYVQYSKLMIDMQVVAWQTDMTRVASFMLGRDGSNRAYREIGISDGHHSISHHQSDPERVDKLIKIDELHVAMFAYLLERLKETPDGDGTLLDHSLIVFGSSISESNIHTHDDLPIVLAGNGERTDEGQSSSGLPEGNAAEQSVPEHVRSRGRAARRRVRRQHGAADGSVGRAQRMRWVAIGARVARARRYVVVASVLVGWRCCLVGAGRRAAQRSRLLEAVKRRDQKGVRALIQAKADVNAAQPDGATALAWAVHLGERRMAEALLAAGANVNTADEYGETPVTLAAANGDAALVQRLLAAGANARAARWNGETAVMIAAGAGSLDAVRQLVRHGADVNAAEPRGGQTALMWAAAEGHGDVVAGLIEMGANVNAASRSGFTPLVFAVDQGRRGVDRRTLLKAGANPNVTVPSGAKPSSWRCSTSTRLPRWRCSRAAPTSRARSGGQHAAASGCAGGDIELVRALLAKGADPNVRTPRSMAPAARRRRGRRTRRPAGEQTPLMMAARGDHEDVMRALVAAGADPALRAQDGSTLLMAAAAGARLTTFKYAYEIDPHVDVVTTAGNTIDARRRRPERPHAAGGVRSDPVPGRPRRQARRDERRGPHADCDRRQPAGRSGGRSADQS